MEEVLPYCLSEFVLIEITNLLKKLKQYSPQRFRILDAVRVAGAISYDSILIFKLFFKQPKIDRFFICFLIFCFKSELWYQREKGQD